MNTLASTDVYVAKEFSRYPAGRFTTDGPNSGQRFRDGLLIPSMERAARVRVHLDSVLGYGSSFLEEAFGGLVRDKGFSAADLRKKLDLISSDESLIKEIWQYIDEESERLSKPRRL